MSAFSKDRGKKGKELCIVVVETLQNMMRSDAQAVAMEADLGGASDFTKIQKSNPDRFVQCGISEADMVDVAAGLSMTDFKPYLRMFGPFASRRIHDQILLSGAYAGGTMNIHGSDPEFTAEPNGGTHTTWEDVVLMCAIPHAVVCDVVDEVQLNWVIREFAKTEGVHYIRANRKDVRNVYEKGSTFEMGKGNTVRERSNVLIISTGRLMSDALGCAEVLSKQRVSVGVIDMLCIKPLDEGLIIREATGKEAVVMFEDHSIISGLGSTVAEVLVKDNISTKFKRHGIKECFDTVGTPEFLQKEFRLTVEDLLQTMKSTPK